MAELIALHTGQTVEQIDRDSDRDRWFTAEEAKDYGFVDHVVRQRQTRSTASGAGCPDPRHRPAVTDDHRRGSPTDAAEPSRPPQCPLRHP